MTEKIQYFLPDLSKSLGIGRIYDIHIADVGGRKVLRIECESVDNGGYKTVTSHKRESGIPKRQQNDEPKSFGEKAAEAAKDFLFNPKRNKGKNFGEGSDFGRGRF